MPSSTCTITSGSAARSVAAVATIASLCLLLGGTCAPADDHTADPVFVEVEIENVAYRPKDITIQAGQTVRWINNDPVAHTVTSGNPGDADEGSLFDSGDLIQFDSFSHQFNVPGEYVYHCRRHPLTPAMVGATVIVQE